jgi:ABC-type glycerol-3-phosphate transport system substrate-binding protein
MKIQKAVSISLLLFALLLGLAACGGSSSTSSSADDSLPATDTAVPTLPPDIIVVLKDTKIVSTMTTFKPGVPYRIVLSNQGSKDHQFAVLSASLNVAQMTATQLQKAALAYVPDVAPGKSAIIDFTFPATAVGVSYEMASYPKSSSQGGVVLPIAVKQ